MSPEELQVMFNVQSRAFKDCLEIFTAKYENQIKALNKQFNDMERSIEFKDKMYDDLIKRLDSMEKILKDEQDDNQKNIHEMNEEVKTLKDKILEMESRQDYQDDQSRRNNIRISGLPEDANETWEMTQQKVADLLKEKLEMPDVEIERAHRTGRRLEGKPRQVVAKMLRYCDREKALRNSNKLKPPVRPSTASGSSNPPRIYINEDLCPASLKKRKDKQPELVQAREQGKFARFVHTRLVVKESRRSQEGQGDRSALGSTSTWGDRPVAVSHEVDGPPPPSNGQHTVSFPPVMRPTDTAATAAANTAGPTAATAAAAAAANAAATTAATATTTATPAAAAGESSTDSVRKLRSGMETKRM